MLERFKYYLSCGHPHNTTDLEFCRGQAVGPICEGQDLQYGKVSITSRYAPVQCTDEAFQKIKNRRGEWVADARGKCWCVNQNNGTEIDGTRIKAHFDTRSFNHSIPNCITVK